MPLSRLDCPLVTEPHARVIDRFNELSAIVARIEVRFPNLTQHKDVQAGIRSLEEVAERLRRSHYRIGFIGVSQAGKSTTVCSLLNLQEKDSPTPTGSAGATTSAITRIRRDRTKESGLPEKVRLNFMSQAEFDHRRSDLCRNLVLDASQSDAKLIEELKRRIANTKPPNEEDLRYLLRLLTSYGNYRSTHIGKSDLEGSYLQRGIFVTHQGVKDSPYALLREMNIDFPTTAISPELELIDLPGLGVDTQSDVLLTLDFLRHLDGAVIFQESGQVTGESAGRLIRELMEGWDRLTGRVWMVVTKSDNLMPNHKFGDGNGVTFLDHLEQFVRQKRLPPEQVVLVGNHLYMGLLKSLPSGASVDGQLPRPDQRLYDKANIDVDSAGNPVIPEGFRRHEVLCRAYEHVVRDGGIPRLRQVLQETLAESVRSEICRDARLGLRQIALVLRNEVASGMDRAVLPLEALEESTRWETSVQVFSRRIPFQESCFEEAGQELRKELLKLVDDRFPAQLTLTPDQIPVRHASLSKLLNEFGVRKAAEIVVRPIYKRMSELFAAMPGTPIVLPGQATRLPHDRWQKIYERDTHPQHNEWYADVFRTFENVSFLQKAGLRREQYLKIMGRKVDSVVFALVGRVVERILSELNAIGEELGRLGHERELVDRDGLDEMKRLLVDLDAFLKVIEAETT
ncbi:MAG: hypothetical protein IT428_05790 [Planctomycetaceae bacterium]|nr:hypothetical protein [Planctomycetaceae bacterium]